jgi:Cu/Ag efflux protein CusF
MRQTGILLAAALVVGASGVSYAQQTITGKVAIVDKAAGKISIQIAGTAGTAGSGTTNVDATVAPTPFKVSNPQLLDVVAKGDRVTVTTENVNGVSTIKSIKKE